MIGGSQLGICTRKVADRRNKKERVEGGFIMVCTMSCVFSRFVLIYLTSFPMLNGSDLSGRMVHKE